MSKKLKIIASAILGLAIAIWVSVGIVNINIENGKTSATITYPTDENEPGLELIEGIESIEEGQGEVKVDGEEIKTVESVESNGPVTEEDDEECAEGEECGRGANFPRYDISSPQAFANATLGQCIDVDGHYGAQCWDSMAAYFLNYTGHTLYTCGSGAAKGTIANGCWQKNATDKFTMVWDKTKIQAGDIVVFSTGQWGHIGMAMGSYNNGYITLLGQNQGGRACPGGGAAQNIINISTRDFMGAFRPNIYIKPEPKPDPKLTPKPTPVVVDKCQKRTVVKGDTLGKIMRECKGKTVWGATMNIYAQNWVSTKVNPGQTVFYGWTHGTGYGLYAGDVIEYKGQ